MIDISLLKQIAKNKVQKPVENMQDLINFLSIWWSNKYKLPSNHPLFLANTVEELVVDYYVDRYVSDPESLSKEESEAAYEKELKEKLGDDYDENTYDYLIDPNDKQENQEKILEKFPNIKEEF